MLVVTIEKNAWAITNIGHGLRCYILVADSCLLQQLITTKQRATVMILIAAAQHAVRVGVTTGPDDIMHRTAIFINPIPIKRIMDYGRHRPHRRKR